MAHDSSPPLDATHCPVSGLPLQTNPRFTNVEVGQGYTVTFRMLGDRIILVNSQGGIGNADMEVYYDHREAFLSQYGYTGGRMVEIRDYAKCHGFPSRKARMIQIRRLQKEDEMGRLCGFLFLNPPLATRIIVRVGTSLFQASYPVLGIMGYRNALQKAQALLEEEGKSPPQLKPEDDSLTYSSETIRIEYSLQPGRWVLARVQGDLTCQDIPGILEVLRHALQRGRFRDRQYTRICDFTEATCSTRKARRQLARGIREVFREQQCWPKRYIICGAGFLARILVQTIHAILPIHTSYCNTVEEAFQQLETSPQPEPAESTPPQAHPLTPYLQELIAIISSVSWDTPEHKATEIAPDHPLKPVHDAIEVVKMDVANLLAEQQEAAQALVAMREQVHQSEKMQAIGQLAGGIAHDFNNQLAVIQGYADMLSHTEVDEANTQLYAERILTAAKHSANLTKQMLAFARKGDFRSEFTDIHLLIAEVFVFLQRSVDKRIRLHQRLDARPDTVLGDPSQLENALLNLALNARDAMPEGGELTFTTINRALDAAEAADRLHPLQPGDYVEIRVTDTGHGIEAQHMARIFEPFFTTKPQGEGTGMGLASVYGTVTNHGGDITCTSTLGEGTEFTVLLPVSEAAEPTIQLKGGKTGAGVSGKILLIDDEEAVAELGSRMLRVLGYDVTIALTGQEAIEQIREASGGFALVLLDIVMPETSGLDVFHAIQEIAPKTPVLVVSGYSLNREIEEILSEGAAGYLQKPFDLAQLTEALKAASTPSSE
ncbi:MAG: hybrid sensor histidine kinase/response regulator [Planctomycetota bacterium]|jgi:signal transduction histidine kinase/ActR/RegA family two-component response regulator